MRYRITLINTFHNTEIKLMVEKHNENFVLSKNQVTRARKALCGNLNCTCSNQAGQRGGEYFLDFKHDGSAFVYCRLDEFLSYLG